VIVSVVSNRRIIFCEGKEGSEDKKGSLDYRLLNRIVGNISGDQLTIVPAGSKFTFGVFAQGYFFPDKVGNQSYIIFRDRDFDVYPTDNIQLLQLLNKQGRVLAFLTHRACVENYLLDVNLIHSYWIAQYIEKQENPSSKWGHGNSPGIETIATWIETSARGIQDYQSVRWGLADLLQMSAAREQLKTTWTGASGKLPTSLTLQDCQTEAISMINQFKQAVEDVNQESFQTSIDKYQNKFSQAEFWQNKQYLIWFNGKDIRKMMHLQQPNYIALNDKFCSWAITQLDINQHSDLMELRTRIEQL